jgi:hypothetical protein
LDASFGDFSEGASRVRELIASVGCPGRVTGVEGWAAALVAPLLPRANPGGEPTRAFHGCDRPARRPGCHQLHCLTERRCHELDFGDGTKLPDDVVDYVFPGHGGEMTALDGNAVAGLLRDIFGVEMTAAIAECGSCGGRGRIAETMSYLRGPGVVLRCRACASVAVVVTVVQGINCVDVSGFRDIEMPGD